MGAVKAMDSTLPHEQLEGGSLSARVLEAHLDWARKTLEPPAYAELLDTLPGAIRRDFEAEGSADRWIDFGLCVKAARTIAAIAVRGAAPTYHALGRHSASRNLGCDGAPHFADPHDFLKRDAMLQGNWVDFGRAVYTPLSPNAGRLELHDWRCYADAFCLSAEGFFERAVAMYGGMRPRVQQSACLCRGDATCNFEIEWD